MRVLQRRWQCESDKVVEIVKVAIHHELTHNGLASSWPFGGNSLEEVTKHWRSQPWWDWLMERIITEPELNSMDDQLRWSSNYYMIFEIRAEDLVYWEMRWGD